MSFLTLIMIIGTFIKNTFNNKVVARFQDPLYADKIEFLIQDFLNTVLSKDGVLCKQLYKYIYNNINDTFYVLITTLDYSEMKARKFINFLVTNSTSDPIDQLVTIDNMLFENLVIYPNLYLIKKMESQEEKIHNLMMKNKEKELLKKQKALKNEFKSGKESRLFLDTSVKVSNIPNTNDLQRKVLVTEKKKRFETSKLPVFICLKEKVKYEIDMENNILNSELNGEMSINIKDEIYKNIEIYIDGDIQKCKFSPKLDKQSSLKGLIRSDKDFSLNKNIALMKWKNSNVKQLPISFSFWPSEVKLNVYQICFEYLAEEDIENLVIHIPKNKISNLVIEGVVETNELVEWNVGSISQGDSDTLEFTCRCEDVNDIFPIDVYFISNRIYSNIDVLKVINDSETIKNCEIKKVLETENFKIKSQ